MSFFAFPNRANRRQLKSARAAEASPARIENLEARRLLASSVVSVNLDSAGTLSIVGTKRADVISVALNSSDRTQLDVAVAGVVTQSFDRSTVLAIHVDAGKGNDVVTIGTGFDIPAALLGGNGNDSLTGGDGDDTLDGGKDKDTLVAGAGADVVIGGKGNDSMFGGDDDDVMRGNDDKDIIRGESGDDNLDGGKGNDDLDGGFGDDVVTGGSDKDRLHGSEGDDDLDGGSGKDDVNGDDGDDRVRGGSDKDLVDGGTGSDEVSGGSGKDHVRGGGGVDRFDDSDANHDAFDDRGVDDVTDDSEHVGLDTVPASVVQNFTAQFPGATVREIEREQEDEGIVFKIDFIAADGTRRRASFTDTGAAAGGDDNNSPGNNGGGNGEHVDPNAVPQAVTDAFNTRYPGATIRELEREAEDEGIIFKIDFRDALGTRRRAEFTEAGTFLSEELR